MSQNSPAGVGHVFYTGYEYDGDTGLNYAGARYYEAKIGRFISQDPVYLAVGDRNAIKSRTGQSLESYLSDPQGFNSYAYARNNPLRNIDPDGQWFMEFMTGKQSWSSFSLEVGEASQYLYENNSTWKTAMDHPIATGAVVGVGGGLAAAGGAVGLTALSNVYLQGAGTACIAFCGPTTQRIAQQAQQVQNLSPVQIRDSLLEGVQNQKLTNIINNFYKPTDRFPGGTAGAIRYELQTGELVGGRSHIIKGEGFVRGLEKVLRTNGITQGDAAKATQLLNDLKSALGKK